jgi:hypothetical protein
MFNIQFDLNSRETPPVIRFAAGFYVLFMGVPSDRLGVFRPPPARFPAHNQTEPSMLDLLFVAGGVALFAVFGVYAILLRRV